MGARVSRPASLMTRPMSNPIVWRRMEGSDCTKAMHTPPSSMPRAPAAKNWQPGMVLALPAVPVHHKVRGQTAFSDEVDRLLRTSGLLGDNESDEIAIHAIDLLGEVLPFEDEQSSPHCLLDNVVVFRGNGETKRFVK